MKNHFKAIGGYAVKEFDEKDKEVLAYATSGLRVLGSTLYNDNEIPKDMEGARDGFFAGLYENHKTVGKGIALLAGAMFASACVGIAPVNKPPTADVSYKDSAVKNKEITFDASGSYDPDGKIVSYIWNLGDGTKQETLDPWIKHAYKQVGNYTGRLTVVDDKNASSSKDFTIEVFRPTPALDYAKSKGLPAVFQEKITKYHFDADEIMDDWERAYIDYSARILNDNIIINGKPLTGADRKNVLDDLMDNLDTDKLTTLELAWRNSGISPKYRVVLENGTAYSDFDGDGIKDRNENGMNKFVLNPIVDFKDTNNNFAIINIPVGYSKTFDGYVWDVSEEKYSEGMVRVDLGKTSKPENIKLSENLIEQFYPEFGMKLMYVVKPAPPYIHIILDARDFLLPLGVKEAEKESVTFYIGASKSYLKKNENKFKIRQSLGIDISKNICYDAEQTIDFIPKESYSNIFITDYKFSFLNLEQKLQYYAPLGLLFELFDNNDKLIIPSFRLADIYSLDDYASGDYQRRYDIKKTKMLPNKIIVELTKGGKVIESEIWDNYYYIPPEKRHEYKIIKEEECVKTVR
ncbi:MAG: PKD domain-containing protein [Methanobacteriota archaeon]